MPTPRETRKRQSKIHTKRLRNVSSEPLHSRTQTRAMTKILNLIDKLPRGNKNDQDNIITELDKNPQLYPLIKRDALNKGFNIVLESTEYASPTALTHRKTMKKHRTFSIRRNLGKTKEKSSRKSLATSVLGRPPAPTSAVPQELKHILSIIHESNRNATR